MQGINVNDAMGMAMAVIMIIMVFAYILYRRGTYKIRYFCLTLGTTYLMLSAYRSIFIFATGALFPLAYYLKDVYPPENKKSQESNRKNVNILLVVLCIAIVAAVAVKFIKYDDSSRCV